MSPSCGRASLSLSASGSCGSLLPPPPPARPQTHPSHAPGTAGNMPVSNSQTVGKADPGFGSCFPQPSSPLGSRFFSDRYLELLFSDLDHRLQQPVVQPGLFKL